MWLSLFAVVLVLTMTFFQGLQGLFSAMITCVLTILSAALAFGFYEDLYLNVLMEHLPDQGRAVALVGIFVVSLIVLRVAFDILIAGNMQFPVYVDRAGGGAFGFVTAMIIVGVLSVGIHMLPFGPSFLGFSRYALVDETGKAIEPGADLKEGTDFRGTLDWGKVEHRRRTLWLNPDGFTVGLVKILSSNALRGRNTLASVHPNLLDSIYGANSGVSPASRTVVEPGAISIVGYWDMPPGAFYKRQLIKADPGGNRTVELKPIKGELPGGRKALVVRVRIDADARDPDSNHRFTTWQMRLVGTEGKKDEAVESFVAGASHQDYERWVELYEGESVVRPGGKDGSLIIDLVFLVPDRADYKPVYLEYKQNAIAEFRPLDEKARAKLGPAKPLAPEKPKEAKPQKKPKPPETSDGGGKPLRDRISGIGSALKDSVFKNELPFALTNYGGNCEVVNGEVRGGRLIATLGDDWKPTSGGQPPAERFEVPADKRLLQLSVEKLQPQSWLGQIYGGIIDTIRDFYVVDESGKEHRPVGHYAMAVTGGKPTFELIYLDESQRDFGRLPKFETIRGDDLKGDYSLFFLFHLPPGCKPVKVHTGRTDVDLREMNLVAPQ